MRGGARRRCHRHRRATRNGGRTDMTTITPTDRERSVVDAVPKGLLIGGRWRESSSGATLSVEDPATGQSLCEVADGTPEDGLEALSAAAAAPPGWAAPPPPERGAVPRRA